MTKYSILDIENPAEYLKYIDERERNLNDNAAKSRFAQYSWVAKDQIKSIDFSGYSLKNKSFRTPFQIDYDLITYSKYFSKLSGKTQVFISPSDIQLLTRASHTNIVVTLAEDLARGLSLNSDLVRAMAQGHDIGHTAFGHAGENELDKICLEHFCYTDVDILEKENNTKFKTLREKYGQIESARTIKELTNIHLTKIPVVERLKNEFDKTQLQKEFYINEDDTKIFVHSKQSFRLLCLFEAKQITAQTIYGIINHTNHWKTEKISEISFNEFVKRTKHQNPLKECNYSLKGGEELFSVNNTHKTYESQILKFADNLAFSLHDLDDALRAKILDVNKLKELFAIYLPNQDFEKSLVGSNRYTQYIIDFISENRPRVERGENLKSSSNMEEILEIVKEKIILPEVHKSKKVNLKSEEGRRYIRGLSKLWPERYEEIKADYPNLVPEIEMEFKTKQSDLRKFCDFISMLTDEEIIRIYRKCYGPEQ